MVSESVATAPNPGRVRVGLDCVAPLLSEPWAVASVAGFNRIVVSLELRTSLTCRFYFRRGHKQTVKEFSYFGIDLGFRDIGHGSINTHEPIGERAKEFRQCRTRSVSLHDVGLIRPSKLLVHRTLLVSCHVGKTLQVCA